MPPRLPKLTPPKHLLLDNFRKGPPLALNSWLPPLKQFTRTKDISYHPVFRGLLFPWVWRVYTERFTRAGHYFLVATLFFSAFGSLSLDQQWYVPFTYASGLWVTALVGMWTGRPAITLNATHATRVSAGETLPVEIEVTALRRRAVGLTVLPDRLPPWVDAVSEEGAGLPVLEPDQTGHVQLGLLCRQRGAFRLRGFRVETAFPLGLMVTQRVFSEDRPLLVYPHFTPLARLDAPIGRRYQPGGVALASHLGDSFEFIGNREYRDGDSVRSIDWRATARLGRPVVREFREEYFLRAAVILDTYVPVPPGYPIPPAFERAVSVCAAVSDYMARSEYLVDLFAAGPELHQLTAGRSLAYLDEILDLLACVDTSDREAFDDLELELMEHLGQIAMVVCLFLDWDTTRRDFVERLREQGSGVKVIIVRDTPCTLPPIAEHGRADFAVLTSAQVDAGVEAV